MRKRISALLIGAVVALTSVAMPVNAAEAGDVVIEEAFPDYDLQACISDTFDKDADGILSADEIAAATELVIDSWSYWVADLTGIEYLTELRVLNAEFSSIETIDVSKNTKLEELNVALTYLESIDLSNCPELKVFNAEDSYLDSVDFSNNSKLEEINIIGTTVAELDLDNLTELKKLEADNSKLASLDVTGCTKLERLDLIGASNITALDLTNNTALKSLDISGTGITALDLSNNTALEELKSYNRSDLYWKTFEAAPISNLDLTNNTALEKLYLDGTDLSHLKELDLTKYPALVQISLEDTGLKSITFNDEAAYDRVYLTGNQLVSAVYPKNTTEGAKVEFGTQTRTVKVPSTDTLETYDLNTLVDITKVEVTDSELIDYNAETGSITFTDATKKFSYKYYVDADRVMDVTITVEKKTVEEEAAEKEAADKEAAQPVIDMINAIGAVTLESEEAIAEARAAYDALTEDQKQYVDNYDVLTAAEEALAELKAADEETEEPDEEPSEEPDDNANVPEDGTEGTGEPEDSDDETGSDEKDSSTVKTGDTTSVMPYLIAMVASLAVILRKKFAR